MEAVILAAGRGQRMEGLAKPFFKPLLELNGIPLLAYAVEYASASGATSCCVVVSPHNKDEVSKVLSSYSQWIRIVVQEEPLGPGHATLLALKEVKSDTTMLLMSDNIMDQDTVVRMALDSAMTGDNAIGVRTVSMQQAHRFTRIRSNGNESYDYVEGPSVTLDDAWQGSTEVKVWCGPVIFNTNKALQVFSEASKSSESANGELKIGPYLSQILSGRTMLVDVEAIDVGIPSAYAESGGVAQ